MKKTDYINKWIETALNKTININPNSNSSYGLKHYCEESIGIYVSNEEIKQVMKQKGFIAKSIDTKNEIYNISSVVNKVIFNEKLGNTYNNNNRIFNKKSKTIVL